MRQSNQSASVDLLFNKKILVLQKIQRNQPVTNVLDGPTTVLIKLESADDMKQITRFIRCRGENHNSYANHDTNPWQPLVHVDNYFVLSNFEWYKQTNNNLAAQLQPVLSGRARKQVRKQINSFWKTELRAAHERHDAERLSVTVRVCLSVSIW